MRIRIQEASGYADPSGSEILLFLLKENCFLVNSEVKIVRSIILCKAFFVDFISSDMNQFYFPLTKCSLMNEKECIFLNPYCTI